MVTPCTLPNGMLIKCQQCGAPLDVEPNEQVVKCQFCKATTRVAQSYQPPVPFSPPPAFPQPQGVRPRPKGNPGCAIGVLSVIIALVGAGVAGIAALGTGASTVIGKSSSVVTGSAAWNTSSGACLLDANGDGVFDVGGMTGAPGTGTTPTIIDGKTGDVIWEGEASPKGSVSTCAGDGWLVVSRPDFRIEFHNARKPEVPVKYLARDKLQAISLGKGCVSIKTDDGTTAGVALPGGTATKCDAPKPRRLTAEWPGVVGLTQHGTTITVGSTKYSVKKRKTGTKMLTVEVSKSGKTLWSKELPYAAPTFNTAIAVGQGMVLVWAASPADRKKAILVGLDAKTGTQKYEHPQNGLVTNTIEQFRFNGRYVIAMYWGKVYAYEPKTGEIAWTAG